MLGRHKFRLNHHDGERLSSLERSDCVWIWPEVLALYIEKCPPPRSLPGPHEIRGIRSL